MVERGFAGTSTTLVSERAGVSRGAQLHHFPTKNDLVVAAVEHVTEVRGAELAAAAERGLPRGARRTRAVLELLADHFTSPVFTAALELWVAARTDEALREAVVPLEQRVGRQTHRMTVELLGADESQRGRARAGAGDPRPGARPRAGRHHHRRRPAPQARSSTAGRSRSTRPCCVNALLESVLADLAAEGDRLESAVAPARRGRLARADAGRGLGRRDRQVAHLAWTDEAATAAATDKEAWDALVLQALDDPEHAVDQGCRGRSRRAGR